MGDYSTVNFERLQKKAPAILLHFGMSSQMVKLIEEMSELTQECCKHLNDEYEAVSSNHPIQAEIADCMIMLFQMMEFFGPHEIGIIMDQKLDRVLGKVDERKL